MGLEDSLRIPIWCHSKKRLVNGGELEGYPIATMPCHAAFSSPRLFDL